MKVLAPLEATNPILRLPKHVKATIDEALLCKQEDVSKTILFNLCGHGHFDMQAYIDYQAGQLVDTEYSAEEVAMALAGLPVVDKSESDRYL